MQTVSLLLAQPVLPLCESPCAVCEQEETVFSAFAQAVAETFECKQYAKNDDERSSLLTAVVLLVIIPFTLVVILPTNKRLESQELDLGSEEAGHVLRRGADFMRFEASWAERPCLTISLYAHRSGLIQN